MALDERPDRGQGKEEGIVDGAIAIKGYRVKGGAVVRVIRGDRVRRYRVTGRRFCALRLCLAGTCCWHGYFGSSTLDIYTKGPTLA